MKKGVLISLACILVLAIGCIILDKCHLDAIAKQKEQPQQEIEPVQPEDSIQQDETALPEDSVLLNDSVPVVEEAEPEEVTPPAAPEKPAEQEQEKCQKPHVIVEEEEPAEEVIVVPEYVDLGLPSGTMWKSTNEKCGLLSYDDAMKLYKKNLPTKAQITELQKKCKWVKMEGAYKVIGPNNNFIILPMDGYRNCSGQVNRVGSSGNYWSSTPDGRENAWRLGFEEDKLPTLPKVSVTNHMRCYGRAIRLVK